MGKNKDVVSVAVSIQAGFAIKFFYRTVTILLNAILNQFVEMESSHQVNNANLLVQQLQKAVIQPHAWWNSVTIVITAYLQYAIQFVEMESLQMMNFVITTVPLVAQTTAQKHNLDSPVK